MVSAAEHPDRVAQHRCVHRWCGPRRASGSSSTPRSSAPTPAPCSPWDATTSGPRSTSGRSGLAYTFLRDNLYADFFPMMVGPDGVIRGPAGDGRVAAVAQDDIADVAVAVLTDPAAHAGAATPVRPGGADPDRGRGDDQRRHRSARVATHEETVPEAYASRASYGAPRLAGRGLGVDLHRHRRRRVRRGQRATSKPSAAIPRRRWPRSSAAKPADRSCSSCTLRCSSCNPSRNVKLEQLYGSGDGMLEARVRPRWGCRWCRRR